MTGSLALSLSDKIRHLSHHHLIAVAIFGDWTMVLKSALFYLAVTLVGFSISIWSNANTIPSKKLNNFWIEYKKRTLFYMPKVVSKTTIKQRKSTISKYKIY